MDGRREPGFVPMRRVAYLTDVEGRWEKVASFCDGNPDVSLDASERLHVREGAVFVFGGDAVDRGPAGRKVVRTLLEARLRQPDRVVLLAGNRDLNKMRLARELRGLPSAKLPPEVQRGSRVEILRGTFEKTMGASKAFENRRAELVSEGRPAGDEDVVESYIEELAPDGAHARFLAECRLAHREGGTLFVHGAVGDQSLGHVPDGAGPTANVSEWLGRLDAFLAREVRAFRENDPLARDPGWLGIVAYQAPLAGTQGNPTSVVYGRPTDELGNPRLPPRATRERLLAAGIHRLVVGHTPSGDCPAIVRGGDFELVLADNSYGRVELGSRVFLEDGGLRVEGQTVLDGGEECAVAFDLRRDAPGPVGLRDGETGRLVKGRLARGDFLSFFSFGRGRVEQLAVSEEALAGRPLEGDAGA